MFSMVYISTFLLSNITIFQRQYIYNFNKQNKEMVKFEYIFKFYFNLFEYTL